MSDGISVMCFISVSVGVMVDVNELTEVIPIDI